MCPHFEDDDDPKKPRPIDDPRKIEGMYERAEARKDHERDHHRHVNVRC